MIRDTRSRLVQAVHPGERSSELVCLLLACLLLAGWGSCRSTPREVDWEDLAKPLAFKLGGGDRIHIEVEEHPELGRDVVVRPDGMINLPLVGEVSARDRLPEQLAEEIARQLERFVKNPVVNVSVSEINSYAIYVLGEVRKPGEFRATEPRTVLQSLALAGGLTPFAAPNRIHVLRKRPSKTDLVIPIHYDDIVSGKAPEQNILLHSGDTVVVP
ncbi:MAG: hypothetical protein FJ125_13885, partial [Deltaproteobacteria bacterium]|nr:hypothetical protein [Deltaproteobacteria bacterium]